MAARAGAFSMHVFRKGQIRPQEDVKHEVDESLPVIAGYEVPDGYHIKLPDMPKITGYENIGFNEEYCPPPEEPPIDVHYKQSPFKRLHQISEEDAKEALIKEASDRGWGRDAATKMWLKRLESVTAYEYILETFSEGRTTKWKSAIYHDGDPVDGPDCNCAPLPWDVPAKPKSMFKDETKNLQIPHTEIVKGCHKCNQAGYLQCPVCRGRGKLKCGNCQGKGIRKRLIDQEKKQYKYLKCDPCGGDGKVECSDCDHSGKKECNMCGGFCKIKWHITLTVTWKKYVAEHLIERTVLPDELVSQVPGHICFQDTKPKVLPLRSFPDIEITNVSRKFLRQHKFSHHHIIMQNHRIRAVPVTQCKANWNGTDFEFIVYGLNNNVYCPDYPQQCVCSVL